jgi:endonuclease/exonuclease/phosphatase family metal-dependent hydrolase
MHTQPPRPLRVATLNIWQKFGPYQERSPRLLAGMTALMPDLIGLQEVRLDPNFNQMEEMSKGLGYEQVFGESYDDGDGKLGNAILSRFPVVSQDTIRLPSGQRFQARILVHARIKTPFGSVSMFTTHLNFQLDDGSSREEQVIAIAQHVKEYSAGSDLPAILVGDFNADPDADEIRYLKGRTRLGQNESVFFADAWDYGGTGPGATYCKRNPFGAVFREPDRRIDYVFVHNPDCCFGEPLHARVCFDEPIDGMFPTDHFGVVAEISTTRS